MDKEVLYRYVAAKTSQSEEAAVLEYIKASPEHLEELHGIQRQYEVALMCAPLINKLHDKGNERRQRRFLGMQSDSWRALARGITAAAALVAVGIFAWSTFVADSPAQDVVPTKLSTPLHYSNVTGKSKLILPDGTVAWLHNEASLKYDADFCGSSRNVTLQGEAYFDVAKDSEHPFIIDVNNLKIEVLGTSFNVAPSDSSVEVSLVEGRVKLEAENLPTMEMTAGHIARYNGEERSINITEGDASIASLWAQDNLSFKKRTLTDICDSLEVWYGCNIYLDPQLSLLRFTFTLTTEPIESVLAYLKYVHPYISYTFGQDGSVKIHKDNSN